MEDTEASINTADDSPRIQVVQDGAMDVDVMQAPLVEVPMPASATALAATRVPEKEDERFRGSWEWKLVGVRDAPDKIYSDNFDAGTYTWRLLAFPRGNQRKPNLSLYLDCPDTSVLPHTMCPRASFTLTVVNQADPSRSWSKEANHTFTAQESDWGFTETILLADMNNPANGWIKDDTLLVRVNITVHKDDGYAARATGFVGLKNQGATCYMNSLLQYLYNVPYFRKAVYHMPTSELDEPSKNMPLALQSLFFKLQYARSTVSTKDLTKSFGWNSADAFMQHDVQELNRVLCEKLEEKMKGTTVERVVNDLFEGTTINYIECINVPCTSERKETFMDLQLDVKGCRNIYESFDRYTEIEMMEGANQYAAEGHGLQDAKRGVLFHSFPPLLQLQVKRFEYDFQRDVTLKINDRYEFFDELDLDREGRKYLARSADPAIRNVYRLHSVLVHSGGVHGGHYFAFVRPDGKTWLKFDDERVSYATAQQAMEEQYGDDDVTGPAMYGVQPGHLRFPKHSNAYMLVYIRADDWDRIMCSTGKEDLAPPLRQRFEAELADKERRQREKAEAHMYISVKVATDADIRDQIAAGRAFDLLDHELLAQGRGAYRVPKGTRLSEFKALVEKSLGVPIAKQRFWSWARRPNGTYRVASVIDASFEDKPLLELKQLREQGPTACKTALMDLRLYLETPRGTSPADWAVNDLHVRKLPKTSEEEVFLFVKLYDPVTERLTYVGARYLPIFMTVREVAAAFAKKAGVPEGTQMQVFEEVKPEPTLMINALERRNRLDEAKLMDGDILIIQPRLPPEQAATARLPSIEEYMHFVQQRRFVVFKPLLPEEGGGGGAPYQPSKSPPPLTMMAAGGGGDAAGLPNRTGTPAPQGPPPGHFELELRQSMTYEEVTQALAAALGMNPPEHGASLLRLTQHNVYTHAPQRQPLKNRTAATLQTMLATTSLLSARHAGQQPAAGLLGTGAAQPNDVLYYEVLDMPLDQLEQLKTLKVRFHKPSGEAGPELVVRLKRDALVGTLLEEAARQVGSATLPPGRPLRLIECHSSKMYKIYGPGDSLEGVEDSYWQLRVEAVPEGEEGLEYAPTTTTGERLLPCCHIRFAKQASPDVGAVAPGVLPAGPPSGQAGVPMDVSQQGTAPGGSPAGSPPPSVGAVAVPGTPPPLLPALSAGGGHTLIHAVPVAFGDPLLVRCGPQDTLAALVARLKAKLGVSDEELAKWRWLLCCRGVCEVLGPGDVVGPRLAKLAPGGGGLTDSPFLGMEHEDDKPRRREVTSSRLAYEKPVKIYA